MTINWGVFLTPEFLIGVVIIGLLLNVAAAYVVRSLDWVARALPAFYRRNQEVELARVQKLTDAAMADHALYAALAAEATRFRTLEVRCALVALVCFGVMIILVLGVQSGEVKSGMQAAIALVLVVFLIALGFYQYSLGLDSLKRARRLDAALRQIQRNLKLPIMD